MNGTRIGLGFGQVAVLVMCGSACGQSYYPSSGGTLDFAKAPLADPGDEANWDRITDSVAITRGNLQGIYNPIQESGYNFAGSPLGTLWYFGGTVEDVMNGVIGLDDFDDWYSALPPGTPLIVGMDAVLYLEAEDAYLDLVFTEWGVGPGGGGSFAYTRAVIPAPATGVGLGLVGVLGLVRRRRSGAGH